MSQTTHKDKLYAALANPKCRGDKLVLEDAIKAYNRWIQNMNSLTSSGRTRVNDLVELLNEYKNELEVELIMRRGSDFLRRQKGQLKLDNTVLEEFLIHLIHPKILKGLENLDRLQIGPQQSFMSLAFLPTSLKEVTEKPRIELKRKDQDFVVGGKMYYKFSCTPDFESKNTTSGELILAVLAAECKVNLDKTMFQEAAGTAARLKMGCPVAKYYLLVEYLDMTPEDSRLTAIDNVFLLRKARRLPYEKRDDINEVEQQHARYPISSDIVWCFVREIQNFINAVWYDPDTVLERGSFI